jgi:DNA-binding GntR family transcriptional regulator
MKPGIAAVILERYNGKSKEKKKSTQDPAKVTAMERFLSAVRRDDAEAATEAMSSFYEHCTSPEMSMDDEDFDDE